MSIYTLETKKEREDYARENSYISAYPLYFLENESTLFVKNHDYGEFTVPYQDIVDYDVIIDEKIKGGIGKSVALGVTGLAIGGLAGGGIGVLAGLQREYIKKLGLRIYYREGNKLINFEIYVKRSGDPIKKGTHEYERRMGRLENMLLGLKRAMLIANEEREEGIEPVRGRLIIIDGDDSDHDFMYDLALGCYYGPIIIGLFFIIWVIILCFQR
ncbi:hypothetical protein ABE953_04370 [Ligilactobacillus salivarius]|uniref:hypothetical protein n=1 Tax=Ligilactobacillus salivarius TaxID=1624 RepID=UPI003977700A